MNYYVEIKQKLIDNELTKRVKDYSKNKSDLTTYYNVGKLLSEAGKHYGEGIIKEYSKKLTLELGKGYSWRNLYYMKLYYELLSQNEILQAMPAKLSWTHYSVLLTLKDVHQILYYVRITEQQNLSYRQLKEKIKNKEYERLDSLAQQTLINTEINRIASLIKHPILIKNNHNYKIISERLLKNLILEDISNFMSELGEGFSFIDHEYKIKLGDRYNYIDLLLYNYIYNCFVVVELKITELKAEHIGQIQKYMNYIDKNMRQFHQEKTIGIIIAKKDNQYVMEYCSDNRIYRTTYQIQ